VGMRQVDPVKQHRFSRARRFDDNVRGAAAALCEQTKRTS